VFERFTEPARRVVVLGREEARALGHGHIGTEHLLLGLLREDEGVAARALDALGLSADAVRARVVETHGVPEPAGTGDVGFTAPARRALESAAREAARRRDRHVATEHLLLGLIREPDSPAAQLLADLCDGLHEVEAAVERALDRSAATVAPLRPVAGDPGELGRALQGAAAAAEGKRPVDGADLLIALAEAGGIAAAALAELGVDREGLRRAVEAARRR
jgi:ATP-dependent Clp protease ATP-binding subunit ClpC